MTSDNMPLNYATSDEMKYGAHYVTLVSSKVSYESPTGQFVVTYVTPNSTSSKAVSTTLPKISTANVVNKDNLGTSRITTSNYISITVPMHFFYITEIKIKPNTTGCGLGGLGSCKPEAEIKRKEYTKGQKFVVVNAGGQIDSPSIIGVV